MRKETVWKICFSGILFIWVLIGFRLAFESFDLYSYFGITNDLWTGVFLAINSYAVLLIWILYSTHISEESIFKVRNDK